MSLPKPLMFTVGLIDQITKPIAKISQQFNGLASNYQAGTIQMATGVAGMAAAGMALQSALMPAIEMDRVLGEVKSLDVRDSALKQLANTSYEYALKYGKSATEFVSSSYDIQSAISGLSDSDLSQFTLASNVLASATKADAATITNYMGTMYGIFKSDANAMGKSDWVEQLTGMTATAVQAFKTDGKKMSDAFGALGASAGLAPLQEQMAVLGTLQSTMAGGESATKYKSFLAGAGKAQKALGMNFVDSQGKMLPMVDILQKLQGQFGELSVQADIDKVTSAFGSGEATALIQLLLKDVDGLSSSINKLGEVKGMGQAEKMAAAMTDQSERLSQSWFVIRAAFGSAVLPAFNEFVGWVADMGKEVLWFTQTFPNLTRVLGYAAIAILGLVAAGGALTVMVGVSKMAMTSWSLVTDLASWSGKGYTATLAWMRGAIIGASINTQLFMATIKASTAYQWAASVATAAWGMVTTGITATLGTLRNVMVGVNAVMLANPIGLIVAGIVLAIAAVGALVYYWDDLKATMSEWGWVQSLVDVFESAWNGIKTMAIDTINGIIETINMLPGVEFDVIPNVTGLEPQQLIPEFIQQNNQQTVPTWMQQTAANDVAKAAPMNGPWLNDSAMSTTPVNQGGLAPDNNITRLPVRYQESQLSSMVPESLMQTVDLQRGQFPPVSTPPMVQAVEMQPGQLPAVSTTPLTQAIELQHGQLPPASPPSLIQNVEMQRNALSPYQPEQVTPLSDIKPVANESMANAIKPRINQQAAMSAKANRVASQSNTKSLSFGDVIIHNSNKNLSLAEIADQQELMTG